MIEDSPGHLLETLTWQEAESVLTPDKVVVIPLGAAAKQHGPHLPMNTDFLLAESLKWELIKRLPVVVTPTVTMNYYPAFVDYPGSMCLSSDTAAMVMVEMVQSLARFGPKCFYVLNTGISTETPLTMAQLQLEADGIVFGYTRLAEALSSAESEYCQQPCGSHADESETSMILALYPHLVRMDRAVPELSPWMGGPFRRQPDGLGTYSASGAWGDPTLATPEKGQKLLATLLQAIMADIEALA